MIRSDNTLRHAPPPGTGLPFREPQKIELDTVRLGAGEDHPEAPGLSAWQKAVAGLCAGVAGLTGIAGAAHAAPATSLVTQAINQTDGLAVTVLPHGTPRVDLLRQTELRSNAGRGAGSDERDVAYSDVGVDLGHGIFHDANGNLSLVPSLAAGWGEGVSDFRQVNLDIPMGYDQSVARFGNTVHHKESPYRRNIYVATRDRLELQNRDGESAYEVLRDGVQFRDPDGNLNWRVTETNGVVHVDGPGSDDYQVDYHTGLIRVDGQRRHNTISYNEHRMAIEGTGSDVTVDRGRDRTEVDGGLFEDYTITRTGTTTATEGPIVTHRMTVDPPEVVGRNSLDMAELTRQIEAAEPGYAARHPLVMAVLEYAVANPGLIDEDADTNAILQAGTAIAGGGGALHSGAALLTGAHALSLAENAQALGAAAVAAKAAAQAAAQAGNLTQAAALAGEAQNLAGQARAVGGEAMRLGERAQSAAQVARIMTGVAGALQIVDGGMDLHHGASSKSIVEGAIAVTEAMHERLGQELTGAQLEQAEEDYSKVMQILNQLKHNANKQMTVGGLKIGCGGLMLISALAGGMVIPPIIGAVGLACTVGTAAYEHWDQLEAFFTGERPPEDPSLRQVLPQPLQDEIHFRLD
ncbi:MAG: hypothetical protein AB7S38_06845 [Vulcanimicrobiota bacterium]